MATEQETERKLIEVSMDLLEIERMALEIRSNDPEKWVRHGLISPEGEDLYRRRMTLTRMIEGQVAEAKAKIPSPSVIDDPRCPPEYRAAVLQLNDLRKAYKDSERMRERLYHLGGKAYGTLLYRDLAVATKAEAVERRIKRLGNTIQAAETWDMERFVERRERAGSKVQKLRVKLMAEYNDKVAAAGAAKRAELETSFAAELADLAAMDQAIEDRRRIALATLAERVSLILDRMASILDQAEPAQEAVQHG